MNSYHAVHAVFVLCIVLELTSSRLLNPRGFSEPRLGESGSADNHQMTITAPKEMLKDVPAIMCAGWRAGVHKDNPALKQMCLGVSALKNLCDGVTQNDKAPACREACTTACAKEHAHGKKKHPICDLPYNATSYDETPPKHSDGRISGWKGYKEALNRCKTQISVLNLTAISWTGEREVLATTRDHRTCTSCKSGYTFTPEYTKSRAGQCRPAEQKERVSCAGLDDDRRAEPMSKDILCTKIVLTSALFQLKRLPANSAAYKHFKGVYGKLGYASVDETARGYAVVRCKVTKHSACRQGNCAVKKSVKCHSVCPGLLTNSHDCGEKGKKLCQGHYTDADGKEQSFGALACRQIAIMA